MELDQLLRNNPTVLAPLAGWSDSIFRQLCKRSGAGWVFTEMVSADGVFHRQQKTLDFITFQESERPISIQLYGNQPEIMARAAEFLALAQPNGLDLNFGCPVKKVVKAGGGAALLRDTALMQEIARRVVQATDLPVSAKIRSGWEEDQAVDLALALQDCGIRAITVHARTRAMQFRGKADWQIIARVKKALSIPVIGNGDVRSPDDAERLVAESGCDGVMIGRGAQGNPWIFAQVRARLLGEPDVPAPEREQIEAAFIEHVEEIVAAYGEERGMFLMRKHLLSYLRGWPLFAQVRRDLVTCTRMSELKERLARYRLVWSQVAVGSPGGG